MAFQSTQCTTRQPSSDARSELEVGLPPKKISLLVRATRYYDPDTGFLVFSGQWNSDVPMGSEHKLWVKEGEAITVTATSFTWEEYDRKGQELDCFGDWINVPNRGVQFRCDSMNDRLPSSPEALERYLGAGRLPGIGPGIAKQMVKRWGMECFKIIEEDTDQLLTIKGLTEDKIKKLRSAWMEKRAVYRIVAFLGVHGVGESTALKIFEDLGETAIEKIKVDPYILTQVEGVGFKTADRVAISFGIAEDSPQRLKAALRYELDEKVKAQGNTAVIWEEWIREGAHQLNTSIESIQVIGQTLINELEVTLRELPVTKPATKTTPLQTKVEYCVSPKWLAEQERRIALDVKRLMDQVTPLPSAMLDLIESGIRDPRRKLDPSQQEGAWNALINPCSVLTGGPGTGKTTTLRSVVAIAHQLGWEVVLAAPTARAAKRMEEAIGWEAMTVHRRLKYNPRQGFVMNASNRMTGQLFVVDESSMLTTDIMKAWIQAIPDGARLLFVGDADQLPPVGTGDIFRDLIQSNICPVSRLTQIHRTAAGSRIAENARRVNLGQMPSFDGNPWTDDYAFIEATTNEDIANKIRSTVIELLGQGHQHDDIQILSPQKDGLVGTDGLNQELRWVLNPLAPSKNSFDETPLCLTGERLMQTVNNYEPEIDLMNGELGTIRAIDDDGTVLFQTEEGRRIHLIQRYVRKMELGYAMTVHKSQGGERPIIIIPISKSHGFTLNRNLLYTGMTRAKIKLILVGDKSAVFQAVQKLIQQYRTTGLLQEFNLVGLAQWHYSASLHRDFHVRFDHPAHNLEAAQQFIEKTHSNFVETLDRASSIHTKGSGVLAGPVKKIEDSKVEPSLHLIREKLQKLEEDWDEPPPF